MAVHIIECYECGDRVERVVRMDEKDFTCQSCGGRARIVFDWGTMAIDIFQPFVEKDFMDFKPVKIESRQDWAKKCEDRGLVSHALNGGYKNYGRRREI